MKASHTSRSGAPIDINHLRYGKTYEATTQTGLVSTGRYLGIEVAYDDWRILLRDESDIHSIAIDHLESVLAA